jgi:hypothetical protein
MSTEKENWYRTGAAAKLLGTSPHRIRELARAGLIESQLRNGYRYIPAHEVERLQKEGVPPMPASADLESEDTQDPDHQAEGPPRPTRGRLAQELYGEPSRQLARSKEKVIQLQHTVEAQRLKHESREIESQTREQQERVRQAQRVQAWRDGHIRRAAAAVPGELCADVCAKVERLLNTVPPCTEVARQVNEIIEAALHPIRQREEQARALDAHKKRIARAVQSINFPYGASSDEPEEARELALTALTQSLPMEATDRQLRNAVEDAIRPVMERINRRQAEKKRRDQEAARKYEIGQILALLPLSMLYSDATPEESAQAKQLVRVALGQVSPTAPSSELYAAKDKALAPIKAAIQLRTEVQRQRESAQRDRERQQRQAQARADSLLSHAVEKRLQKLVDRGTVRFHGDGDRYDLRDKVTRKIRPILVSEIMEAPAISEEQLRERIAHLVDQHHVEFCD